MATLIVALSKKMVQISNRPNSARGYNDATTMNELRFGMIGTHILDAARMLFGEATMQLAGTVLK